MTQPAKRKPYTRRKRRLGVTTSHLYWIKGLLMVRYRRDVHWADLIALTGLTPRAIRHISCGDRIGGKRTLNKLMTLREHGFMIHLSDFVLDDLIAYPSPES